MILKKLTILNYKNIGEATLELSPKINCFIGPNGAGKRTLMVCLDRIGNPHAFARNFPTSKYNSEVDQYKNAVIT